MMSKRISSRSLTTKAAPQSTSQSQRMTLSSCVQPIGSPATYLKAIWSRKAANMAASMAAAMFSARRASQAQMSLGLAVIGEASPGVSMADRRSGRKGGREEIRRCRLTCH
jgi:hypothetical protein